MSNTRVKDAGFLQLHIEKVILGIGVLILLGAFVIFIAGNPFAIDVSGKVYSGSDEIVSDLEMADNRLRRGLQNTNPLDDEKKNVPAFNEEITQMLNLQAREDSGVKQFASQGLTRDAIDPRPSEIPRYAEVTPPVPSSVEFKAGADVFDLEFNRQEALALMQLMGKEPSDDPGFTMLIAGADFEIYEWAKRLNEASAVPGTTRIPAGIWSQRFGIAGVVLLREELDPATGVWFDQKYVEPLPGQIVVMPTTTVPFDAIGAAQTITEMREGQESIARPQLPFVKGFVRIVAPGGEVDEEAADGFDAFGQPLAKEDLGRFELKIKEWEEQIAKYEQRRAARIGVGQDGGAEVKPSNDPFARPIEALRNKIERARPRAEREKADRAQQIARREQMEALKASQAALLGTGNNDPVLGEAARGIQLDGVQLEEDATVRVWAADPTMRPGKTYRYKLVVAAINPLYGVPRLEKSQLEDNKAKASILPSQKEIDKMAWSEPVTVEPRYRFFYTGGSDSRARVEIFSRVDGQMQKKQVDVTPGDLITGVVEVDPANGLDDKKLVDLNVGAVVVDIEARRDPLNGNSGLVMLYLDASGELRERSQATDNSDPIKKALSDEAAGDPQWPLRPNVEADPLGAGAGSTDF